MKGKGEKEFISSFNFRLVTMVLKCWRIKEKQAVYKVKGLETISHGFN